MEKREYVVTVYKEEDLEPIYEILECEHGTEFVPERACECIRRRPLSRNTHYLLTDEEAARLKKDSRIWDVQLTQEELGVENRRFEYAVTQTGDFDKSILANSDSVQWGLYRNFQTGHDTNWAIDATPVFNATINYNLTGKNVDIVVVDDTIEADHPEWAPNQDGTGDTRLNQIDWFTLYSSIVDTLDNDFQTVPNYPYIYSTVRDDNHGHMVASCAAGSRHGMAKAANIYNLEYRRPKTGVYYGDTNGNVLSVYYVYPGAQPLGVGTRIEGPGIYTYRTIQSLGTGTGGTGTYILNSAVNEDRTEETFSGRWTGGDWSLLMWDYLRAFHRYKDVNPETGKRNPTIANCSFGSSLSLLPSSLSNVIYRGTTYTTSNHSPWTAASLNSTFGVGLDYDPSYCYIPFISTAVKADIQDAVKDGILFVQPSGNNNQYIVNSKDSDYNNTVRYLGTDYYYARGDSMQSVVDTVVVGSCTSKSLNYKTDFSGWGDRVDIFAPGENVACGYPITPEIGIIERWEVTNNVATFKIRPPTSEQGDLLYSLNGKQVYININQPGTLPIGYYTITGYSYEPLQLNATLFTVDVTYPDTPQTSTYAVFAGYYTDYGLYPIDTRGEFQYQTSTSGTSFSAPNVTGLLACWMEVYRRMDYFTAYGLLLDKSKFNTMINGPFSYSSDQSLGGALNAIAGYPYDLEYYPFEDERPTEGLVYPKTNYKSRYDIFFRTPDTGFATLKYLAFPRVSTYR